MKPSARIAAYAGRWILRMGVVWCLVLIAGVVCCEAGVVVTENVSPGATSWPGSPIVATVSNPAGQTSVGESFNSVSGCTNYAQTFSIVTTNYTLQSISIYAGGGTGTGTGTNLTLRLFDLGTVAAPNPNPYVPGADLLNSGGGLSIAYSPQTTGVLRFDFNGGDQATLQSEHLYAFELDGAAGTQPMAWERTTSATYPGGAAYRNRSWINGNGNQRAFALAVYGSAAGNTNNPGTNVFFGPNGDLFHGFATPANGINSEGANPAAGLVLFNGVLCGTTLNGGAQGAGTAFYVTLDGSNFNAFRAFTNAPDAGNPQGEFVVSGNGLFGATFGGGMNGAGAVSVEQTNGSEAVVWSFATVNANEATNTGGASPTALIALSGSQVYGTTSAGGAAANGSVFVVGTNGAGFSDLHDFSLLDSQAGTNADGAAPWGGVVLSGGVLYGTASLGGAGGSGVVFSVGTNGSNFTVLYHFSALDAALATNADGAMPLGGLVLSSNTLYGTTYAGGQNGRGTIFSLQTNGMGFAVVHPFGGTDAVTGTNADGASPCATLMLSSGVLYGTASSGGAGGSGVVFALNIGSGEFAALHSFGALANGTNADGAFPDAPVLRVGSSLYGTAFSGGPGGAGTVFVVPIPSTRAVITSIARNTSGSVTLSFMGGPGSTNILQVATNLTLVAWQNVATNVADTNGAWQFTDGNTASPTKFYRSYTP